MATRIIIKKVGGHGGHHGGAWKVAYADFVTAMMALFIVLWLMNTSKQVQEAVGGYFKDPKGTSKFVGEGTSKILGSSVGGKDLLSGSKSLMELKQSLETAVSKLPHFDQFSKQVEMTVTESGLRIELIETEKGIFFDIGNPAPNEDCKNILTVLAEEIGKIPNRISIEGHTDSRPYPGKGYSNWELSVDRANNARRIMTDAGLKPNQVEQVRGYADQALRKKDNPQDPANRRISLIVGYLRVDGKASSDGLSNAKNAIEQKLEELKKESSGAH
jgi:chemotaxis protein MotB